MIKLPVVDQTPDISSKKVFVRGDIDIPLGSQSPNGKSQILDDTRLKDIWPTVEYLLKQGCTVFLAGHLGRPEGKEVPELSGTPVAQWMIDKLQLKVAVADHDFGFIKGYKITDRLFLLENLRFDPREEANDPKYAKELAGLADIYVNEAFAVSEREHASIVGVPKLLPHFAGFRLAKEVEVLSDVLENPKHPLLVVIGGAKLETKLPVISKMAEVADEVIVGGKLLTEIKVGDDLMKNPKVKFLRLTENEKDTTLESIDKLQETVAVAETIIWNGPVGQIEDINYQVGTRRVAEIVAGNIRAYKIVGGGDTVGFLDKLGLTNKFDWVSSGGGSMLRFLAGEKLPGVEALVAV